MDRHHLGLGNCRLYCGFHDRRRQRGPSQSSRDAGAGRSRKFFMGLVPAYLTAQMIGAFLGAVCCWLQFKDHFNATEDPATKLGVFSTAPAIPNTPINLLCEIIATFVLVLGVLYIAAPDVGLGALDALPVALLVFGIGLGMGNYGICDQSRQRSGAAAGPCHTAYRRQRPE